MNKIIITTLFEIILIVLFTPSVMAQNGYHDYGDYDYGSDDSYNDADFYSDSDPNQWDYDKVDWDKVDYSRQDLYTSSDFYDNIPDNRYNELDYTQVEYSKITDHSKIDESKYFSDMGCSGCSLDRGGQDLQFSEDGISHPKGSFVSVPGSYPPNPIIIADSERIIVVLAESVSGLDIPSTDDVTIDTNNQDVLLSDGTEINGRVSSQNGQVYVSKGDQAHINNIEITASYGNVDVYFDGEEHSGNYVSLGEKNIIIQGDNFDVTFNEGNDYVTNLNSEENDRFIVRPLNNGKVTITNRDEQNLAPNVVVTGSDDEEEWAQIKNGNFDGFFGKNGVVEADVTSMLQNDFGSVPMEVYVVDEYGNNLIKSLDGTEGKLIFTNDNKAIMVDPSTIINYDGSAECSSGGGSSITGNVILALIAAGCLMVAGGLLGYAAVDMDRDEKRPEIIANLQKNFGRGTQFNIEFVDIESWSYSDLKTMQDNLYDLYELSPNLVSSMGKIELVGDERLQQLGIPNAAGYADPTTNIVGLKNEYAFFESSFGMSFRTLAHEATHRYHQQMSWSQRAEFERRWYEATNEGNMQQGQAMYKNVHGSQTDTVKRQYPLSEGGWVRDYGSTNIEEDIATTVEQIAAKGAIRDINTNQHYRQKASLLCQYGFLPSNNNLCK